MVLVKCKKCGYSWESKGRLLTITCPSCGLKNKRFEKDEIL